MELFSFISVGNISAVLLVLIAFIILKKSIYIVPQSKKYIVERLGKFSGVIEPGFHVIVPFIDRVAHKLSILERQNREERINVFTKDNVEVVISTVVYWRVTEPEHSVYRIENIEHALTVATTSIVRNSSASLNLDDLQGSREKINNEIQEKLNETASMWGVVITRNEIVDIELDEKTKTSQRQEVDAERARRAQVTQADGEAQAVERTANAKLFQSEKEAQALVVQAKARADEITAIAEADANRIKTIAEAQAKEIELVGQALETHGQDSAGFELRKRQIEAIENLASSNGSRLIIMPTDVTGLLGSLPVLAEALTFGKGAV